MRQLAARFIDKTKYILGTLAFWSLLVQSALADDTITPVTPDTLIERVRNLFVTIAIPLGSAILIGSLILISIKLMLAGSDSRKRQEAIEGLQSIVIGGVILGGVLFFAGVLLGLGSWFSGK